MHVRYPEDMFKVQRTIYARYHVTNANTFYNSADNWTIPDDPTRAGSTVAQPPYYLQLQMPDQKNPEFQLTSTFVRPARTASCAIASWNRSARRQGWFQRRRSRIR